jgi:hypothetical protein
MTLGCTNSDKDPVEPPPEPVVETADTATDVEPPDSDPPVPFDTYDTGTFLDLTIQGWTFIDPGVSLNGWEAIVVQWSRAAATRPPGCVQAWQAKDWLNDPIRANQADPLANNLDACEGCAFTFTVSFTDQQDSRTFPWSEFETPPADTDAGDTDPIDTDPVDTDPTDTDAAAPPPPGSGGLLNCEFLYDIGLLTPPEEGAESWFGYGYDPTLVDPSDPTKGGWMAWEQTNAAWVQFSRDASFQDGVFQWQLLYGEYGLTY